MDDLAFGWPYFVRWLVIRPNQKVSLGAVSAARAVRVLADASR